MTLVVDASVVVGILREIGPDRAWAESLVASEKLAAPHFMPVEAANILRRSVLAGHFTEDAGTLANARLSQLKVDLFPYAPFADRVWELHHTITPYDAWYVALAESLGAPLATLDLRLSHAPGPRCVFLTPPP